MERRAFMKSGALALVTMGLSPSFLRRTAFGMDLVNAPKGKVLGQIVVPEIVANLAFAEDGRTVYLTGSTSIYRLTAKIPGEIPLYYRK